MRFGRREKSEVEKLVVILKIFEVFDRELILENNLEEIEFFFLFSVENNV